MWCPRAWPCWGSGSGGACCVLGEPPACPSSEDGRTEGVCQLPQEAWLWGQEWAAGRRNRKEGGRGSAGRTRGCCHGRRCKVFWDQNSHRRGLMGWGRAGSWGRGWASRCLSFALGACPHPCRQCVVPPPRPHPQPAPPQRGRSRPRPVLPRGLTSGTEGSEWPLSGRPVHQHNGKLVL